MKLTAFGRWAKKQPRGVLSRAQKATGLAWSTVHSAQTELKSTDAAFALSAFTGGDVCVEDIAKHPLPDVARAQLRKRPRVA